MRNSPTYKFLSLGTLALLLFCSSVPSLGSAQIPTGMHALVIHVDHAVFFAVGDHVDVLVTSVQGQTSTIIEDTKIAAVNPSDRVVTLFVSPDVAQRTMASGDKGKFGLRLSHCKK
jgi:hypothetical protein